MGSLQKRAHTHRKEQLGQAAGVAVDQQELLHLLTLLEEYGKKGTGSWVLLEPVEPEP